MESFVGLWLFDLTVARLVAAPVDILIMGILHTALMKCGEWVKRKYMMEEARVEPAVAIIATED